jgi:putative PIN family toxin of toxin-antitoxin system
VAQNGTMLKSSFTEWELHDVLGRRQLAALVPQASREWLMALLAAAELVAITETIAACRDRDDDKFLELAVSGRADFIVSGDADLLALDPFRQIPIVSPATFVERAVA